MENTTARFRRALTIGLMACWLSSCTAAVGAGEGGRILELAGALIPGGVECQLFQVENGEKYTLVGDLKGFKNGDRVRITGEVVEMSHCMQETTLLIKSLTALDPQNSSPKPQE